MHKLHSPKYSKMVYIQEYEIHDVLVTAEGNLQNMLRNSPKSNYIFIGMSIYFGISIIAKLAYVSNTQFHYARSKA